MQRYLAPHRRTVRITGEDRGIFTKVKAAVPIPTTIDVKSKRHIAFSLFYTAAVSIPFVTTVVFWLVLHRSNTSFEPNAVGGSLPVDQAEEAYSFGGRFLQNFLFVNLNAVNSVIALVEIVVLSSVCKQKPFGTRLVDLLAISVFYLAWAGIFGHLITGKFVYKFLDPLYRGWMAVALVVFECCRWLQRCS
ncbi:MAG: hypothetical protein FRX48_01123 [Lasallia pustulata]|uniref:Uncharacterized protein n=1 Tax=Lasallia pustulata TaxID=136370 RepID=A0A5M8Q5D0_9LECA|nr:MAG: hypothetical protein FRX48_01123 [Lasallia pustulata]